MPSSLELVRVPLLQDNYAWLLHDPAAGETLAVDPGEAEPVLTAADARNWAIGQVWNTHKHGDHVGGNRAVKAATGCTITGPAGEAAQIPGIDRTASDGDVLALGNARAKVIAVPGHTDGQIAFHFADDAIVFTGDSLFIMGCGRLFEGTPEQMRRSLQALAALPGETRICCGHEYTLGNARFAAAAEPDNAAITARLAEVEALRAAGEATVPGTVAEELATNPFVRARDTDSFARLRAWKDRF